MSTGRPVSYSAGLGPLGRLCQAGCGEKVPKALNEAGIEQHPCCGKSELDLMYAGKRERTLTAKNRA